MANLGNSGYELLAADMLSGAARGGHDVPEVVVRRRYDRSIQNFLVHYRRLANFWTLFDNSGAIPRVVAFEKSEEVRIIDDKVFGALVKRYGSR